MLPLPTRVVRRSVAALALLAATMVTACQDGPTGLAPNEGAGTITVPADRVAMILAFSPADAVDSVWIGPAAGAPGAPFQSVVLNSRVLVFDSTGTFAPELRFRVFTHAGVSPQAVSLEAETSTARRITPADSLHATPDTTFVDVVGPGGIGVFWAH